MSVFTSQTIAPGDDRVCYCFNRDCQQPRNPRHAIACASCGSDLLLQNRYRALEAIGQGGFGRTFKGIDESQPSHPYCAIKQFWMSPGSNNAEKAAQLFEQEAQRLQVLGSHPQIPASIDYFIEAGGQYLIQEYINGNNLSEELSEEGLWDEPKVRQLLLELLPVLQFVHNHQVIHRDVKPENIIRRHSDRSLVLVDFGAAKLVSETVLAKTGTVIGSAAYTAPEQVKGKAVFASDIYSLGVTCLHLLTGVPPFDLFDSGEDIWKWRDYFNLGNPVSKKLGQILDKMLQGATNKRYPSAQAVLEDLQAEPVKLWRSRKTWLVASAALVLGVMGVRTLVSPVVRQVSAPPSVSIRQSEPPRSPREDLDPGGLYAYSDAGEVQVFPLEHTEVEAQIAGNLSRVEVKQTFSNPYDLPLEATYKFPLPEDAAVDDMEIRIGDRVIRGIIKKREEAKQIYERAKQEGKTAGLLEQERANVFTQSLANIKPGEKIDVVIRYTNSLEFVGGDYEFAFPMVVAPRYGGETPVGNNNSDRWGMKSAFASELEPPYLPETRSGHDIDVTVEIDAGVEVSNLRSPSHEVTVENADLGSVARVELANGDTIPNKDLILRYQVSGAETQATVLAQSDRRGGHFATYLIPAVDYEADRIVPKDVVFLVDTSGSQSGEPIEQSKELMRQFISSLNPDDTFTIIDFSSRTSQLSDKPLANTRENRSHALNYINRLYAGGGTELMNGINTVLSFPEAEDGRLRSIVLLTDGLIGSDEHIIGQMRDRLQRGNRLYSFGVGFSPNRFLLDRLADIGRGTVTVVAPEDNVVEVAEKFFREINNPVVTNIEVSWLGEGEAPEIYPQNAPDLFASQPLVLYGRKADGSSGKLRVAGVVAGGEPYEQILDVNFNQVGGNGAIAQLWGRSRIKELMNQMYGRETSEQIEAVTETALDYRLLSKYTAFVAVTEEVRVDPNEPQYSEDVAVATPEGMVNQPIASVPEPREILGNLLAAILLALFFTRKRWFKFLNVLLTKFPK